MVTMSAASVCPLSAPTAPAILADTGSGPYRRQPSRRIDLPGRRTVRWVLALWWPLALGLLASSGHCGSPHRDQPLNVLWLVVDDISANLSCYGEQAIETPHLDRLAAEGVRFEQAYVTAPVCSACRSAMITGMYQTSIGVHHHRSGRGKLRIKLPEPVEPLPVLFQRAGYYTCNGNGVPRASEGGRDARPVRLGKTDYNFDWDPSMFDGDDWAGRAPGQPFFMQIQLSGGKLRGGSRESMQALAQRAVRELGRATDPSSVELPPHYPPHPDLQLDWATYLDSIRITDAEVGEILARLDAEGLSESTLVIFISDHGISHARGKQFLYDEGTHIPLIMRGPGIAAGQVRRDMVEHIDLAATSLAAAGLPVPAHMHSRDLLAADYQPRRAVFAARDRCDETVERLRSIRTDTFLYIRNYYPERPMLQPNAYKDGKLILQVLRQLADSGNMEEWRLDLLMRSTRPPEELYRWREDRWQHHNLADSPDHEIVLAQLRAALDSWLETTGDHGAESWEMYDSDMAVYLNGRSPEAEQVTRDNIDRMKSWAAQGK
jgi:arylsulfatase A-like enzyme